jgi:hypothetical protein
MDADVVLGPVLSRVLLARPAACLAGREEGARSILHLKLHGSQDLTRFPVALIDDADTGAASPQGWVLERFWSGRSYGRWRNRSKEEQ